MKSALKITTKGQVAFRKKVMDELGVRPGGKITLEVTGPDRAELTAAKPAGTFERYFGMLASPANPKTTIEEMNEIAAKGWAGE